MILKNLQILLQTIIWIQLCGLRKTSIFENNFIWNNKDIKIIDFYLYNQSLWESGVQMISLKQQNNTIKCFHKRGASNNEMKATEELAMNRRFVVINGLPKGIECVTLKELRECFNLADLKTFKATDLMLVIYQSVNFFSQIDFYIKWEK